MNHRRLLVATSAYDAHKYRQTEWILIDATTAGIYTFPPFDDVPDVRFETELQCVLTGSDPYILFNLKETISKNTPVIHSNLATCMRRYACASIDETLMQGMVGVVVVCPENLTASVMELLHRVFTA